MIVPMKHLTLLCVAGERESTLATLRELGCAHLNLTPTDSEAFRHAQARLETVRHADKVLADALADKPVLPTTVGPHKTHGHELSADALLNAPLPALSGTAEEKARAVLQLADMRQALVNEAERLDRDIALYLPFGDFDVSLPARLAGQGLRVQLFRDPTDTTFIEADGVLIQEFGADDKFTYGVMIGPGELPEGCEALVPPEAPVSVLRERLAKALERAAHIADRLKKNAGIAAELKAETVRLADESAFAVAADAMRAEGAVAWITGWLPAEAADTLRETAAEHHWGVLLRDPEPGELPPTLLRPPRLFRPVLTLFSALGISPAYNEADVSVIFFCFFSIFFAMLVGDGGYGALILALTLWARRKLPAAPRAPFTLLTFFSVATIVWGVLSNTWFGLHPRFIDNPASLWLNHPEKGLNNTMLVCFTLGVAHLSLARAWNAVTLFPDTKFLAQTGWVGVVWFMYFMTCQVIGIFPAPQAVYYVFGVSLVLIFLFSLKKEELKTNGIELGMMPLTIVGCLGDIISYVRLFAVGLASVKVAENFNEMAANLPLPLWARIIPMVAILLVGHGLNFLMAGLSVLVHAVRLNTLEFSNHKGVTWSGFGFKPFSRSPSQP